MESKEEKIKIVEDTLEGDSSSKERWEHIQKNLSNIKAGMKRQDVIDFIGYPDWIEFTPENVMQYSVTYFDAEKEEPSASIHIILNDNKRVVEIRSDNTFYGPLPDCEK